MTDEFCESYFRKLIYADDAQKKTTKAFLATEQTIPGLGNGVLQDILYMPASIRKRESIPCLPDKRRNSITR